MTTPTIPRPGKVEDDAKDGGGDLAGKKGKKGAKDGAPQPNKQGAKKKKLIIIGVVLLVAAAAYMSVLKPKPAATGAPVPGAVVKLDPLTLNLDGGHYLKLSMALQFTAGASGGEEKPDGSKALDLAIAQLSNRKVAELNTAAAREAAKKKLLTAIEAAYENDVMDLYFTEFVMQ
ncbi:MAG TPA: flagellar basal body-associated FliL family protein [Sporichthya sp.]|nr:flagellar basal body-associated FliL family protein [Sporichthya sp.]